MIKIYNRKTKDYQVEKVAGGALLNSLYTTRGGKVGLELLIKRKFYSSLTGVLCDTKLSTKKIKSFVDQFEIDMLECSCNIEDFKSFNEFFVRKLKPDVRPFAVNSNLLSSPGDGRLQVWQDVDINQLVQVKGLTFTLKELIGNDELAEKYHGGIYAILRLCPVDYHRFHFMDSGVCTGSTKIKGAYYSVNPVALASIPYIFCLNKREYSILHSDHFGDILYMEVGATSVGSIVQTYKAGARIKRGDEKGYFKFGGSTVIFLLEKGAVGIDEDIITQTGLGFETRVLAGEAIGKKI